MRRIYLDHAATTPTHPEMVKAMLAYFTNAFGNPSSIHSYGQEAKAALEEALDGLPPPKTHRAVLGQELIKSATDDYLARNQRRNDSENK